MNNKVKILVAYHKNTPRLKSDIFTPIHVGRAIANYEVKQSLVDIIGDNIGKNISDKNVIFAEVTAIYWAWKNLDKDVNYVGLMHYSRFFNLSSNFYQHPEDIFYNIDENILTKFQLNDGQVKQLCNEYDAIVPEKWEMRKEHIEYEHNRYNLNCEETKKLLSQAEDVLNLYDHYSLCHIQEDIDLALSAIKEEYPHMYPSVQKSLKQKKSRFLNMFIMRRDIFDEYCEFLFKVIFNMMSRKDYSVSLYKKGSFNSRVFGFLSERLFSIYFDYLSENKKLKFKELQIAFADYSNLDYSNLKVFDEKFDEKINIVFSTDNNYAPYLSVVLASIFDNSKAGDKYQIFILDGGISNKNKKKINNFIKNKNHEINFIKVNLETFLNTCPLKEESSHISMPTYFRFSVPSLLPNNVKKVIYLDCDIIVKSALSDLWNVDILNYFAAVVEDTYEVSSIQSNKLGLLPHEIYFNAGIMVINIEKWRNDKIEQKLFSDTIKILDKIIFVDQDVLNYTLRGNVRYLSLDWNVQQTAYHFTKTNIETPHLEYAKKNPKIIHYSGHIKPWDTKYRCWHPLSDEYFKYLKLTPWKKSIYWLNLRRKISNLNHKIWGWKYEYNHLKQDKLKNMFNNNYYLSSYPDVLESKLDPLFHYIKYGWKEGKNPSPTFNTNSYLENHPDVKESGMNPFYHYLVYGKYENR